MVQNGDRAKLRIAQIAPLVVRVPPKAYGGTERVVHALTEELVRRGHAVTLFAAGSSITAAELCAVTPLPLWEMQVKDPLAYQVLQVEEVVRQSGRFDVIHSHVDHLPWLAGERIHAPLVTTLHGRLDLAETRALFELFRSQALVSISDSQRRPLAGLGLKWLATVHHGLPLQETYHLGKGKGGYVAFVGRIAPEKGADTAIRVAIRAGLPIRIAARVGTQDREYHRTRVAPLLKHPLVQWLGEIDEREKAELLAGASALLMPIEWDEPFGLSFVEALASGTPVIAKRRGSLPELIRDGQHGFFAESEDELVDACLRVTQIDRAACRRWALEHFSTGRMADGYEAVYRRLMRTDATSMLAALAGP
jgi:glycosyltransferase involved in cell wall biosynthesis